MVSNVVVVCTNNGSMVGSESGAIFLVVSCVIWFDVMPCVSLLEKVEESVSSSSFCFLFLGVWRWFEGMRLKAQLELINKRVLLCPLFPSASSSSSYSRRLSSPRRPKAMGRRRRNKKKNYDSPSRSTWQGRVTVSPMTTRKVWLLVMNLGVSPSSSWHWTAKNK